MRVNKTLYVLCSLFLGGVGIHKFCRQSVARRASFSVLLDYYSNHYFNFPWYYHNLLTKVDQNGYIFIQITAIQKFNQ